MASDLEKFDKAERADRLKLARQRANISGPKGVYDASGGEIDVNLYKGHESGRNGYSVSEGRRYADLFGVPLTWLYLGIGSIDDTELPGATNELRQAFAKAADVPLEMQKQIISFIQFQVARAEPSQSQSSLPDDRREQPSHRREAAPSARRPQRSTS